MSSLEHLIIASELDPDETTAHVRWFLGDLADDLFLHVSRLAAGARPGCPIAAWAGRSLSNGSFYIVPLGADRFGPIDGVALDPTPVLSADAAGLCLTLRALRVLACDRNNAAAQTLYRRVHEYACQHPERSAISRAGAL